MPLIRKDPTASAPPASPDDAKALQSPDPAARWRAARDLAGRPEGVVLLAEALRTEPDPKVREAMFTGLARTGGLQAAEAALPFVRSDDADLRTGAMDALRAMGGALTEVLPGLLRDADADVRVLACDLVRHIPPATASDLLSERLASDPEPNVCAAAVEVLAEFAGPEILPALAACGARFPHEPFLVFSISIASRRIAQATHG